MSAIQLQLGLFGAFSVSIAWPDHPEPRRVALSGRPGGLLTLLALSDGQFFSRTDLSRELWPTGVEGGSSSAGSFNTLLWRLRKALEAPPLNAGDIIEADRQGALRLARRVQVSTDVDRYRALVEPVLAKPLSLLDPQDLDALREGAALYQGSVLSSFQDDWALRLRERHRRLQLGALSRLMHTATLAQHWTEAIAYGEALLEIDELREDVHRELMRCYMAHGQRALALRQFERCRTALKRELAIQPMRETLSLYQQIADAATHGAAAPAIHPAAHPPAAVPVMSAPQHFELPSQGLNLLSGTPFPSVPTNVMQGIAQARWHLAQADAQLQLSLPFVV